MVKKCSLRNCRSEWKPNSIVSFHCFPLKNNDLLAKWMQAIPPDLIRPPTKYSCLCSMHFHPECFETKPMAYLINRLKKDAVPSIFCNYENVRVFENNQTMDTDFSSDNSINVEKYNIPATPSRTYDVFDIIDVPDAENGKLNFKIVKQVNLKQVQSQSTPILANNKKHIGVQTYKRLALSEREKEMKKQIGLLQRRLENRDTKIKSLLELVIKLKKHIVAVQMSK